MKNSHWSNRNRLISQMRIASGGVLLAAAAAMAFIAVRPSSAVTQSAQTFNINTLAGKVAAVNAVQGLGIRFSAFIQQEVEEPSAPPPGPFPAPTPITPSYVLSSPLDGTSILPPAVTANQDTAAAPQNETAIAVDPNNPNRIVGGANDYVTRTW
jgi:hypothetical protein